MLYLLLKIVNPNTSVMMQSPRNMLNNTFATAAAPSEIPVKPKIEAMIAITKNVADHFNITYNFLVKLNGNNGDNEIIR